MKRSRRGNRAGTGPLGYVSLPAGYLRFVAGATAAYLIPVEVV